MNEYNYTLLKKLAKKGINYEDYAIDQNGNTRTPEKISALMDRDLADKLHINDERPFVVRLPYPIKLRDGSKLPAGEFTISRDNVEMAFYRNIFMNMDITTRARACKWLFDKILLAKTGDVCNFKPRFAERKGDIPYFLMTTGDSNDVYFNLEYIDEGGEKVKGVDTIFLVKQLNHEVQHLVQRKMKEAILRTKSYDEMSIEDKALFANNTSIIETILDENLIKEVINFKFNGKKRIQSSGVFMHEINTLIETCKEDFLNDFYYQNHTEAEAELVGTESALDYIKQSRKKFTYNKGSREDMYDIKDYYKKFVLPDQKALQDKDYKEGINYFVLYANIAYSNYITARDKYNLVKDYPNVSQEKLKKLYSELCTYADQLRTLYFDLAKFYKYGTMSKKTRSRLDHYLSEIVDNEKKELVTLAE